jgi:hypothetical protein
VSAGNDKKKGHAALPEPFVLRWQGSGPGGEGARWWNEALWAGGRGPHRRTLLKVALASAGVLGFATIIALNRDDDDPVFSMDALELQQREGWNVGQPDASLPFDGVVTKDIDDGLPSPDNMKTLAAVLAPQRAALLPFYVQSLFRVLADARSDALRNQMRFVFTPAMRLAYDRAQAIAALFSASGAPRDVALVLDVPGPEAVAAAAALSTVLEPVWLFDNWPHPLGVVRSQAVLGAALFYLPLLRRNAETRQLAATEHQDRPALPMFVVDDGRLAPYRDEATQFDNRYLARLPSADALKTLGIRRVLYVRPGATNLQELDDLNDDFVRYRNAGVEVRAVALDDFQLETPAVTSSHATPRYYWGGSSHIHFWSSYGWYGGPRIAPYPGVRIPSGPTYQPVERATIFSSRTTGGLGGVGKLKPSGFGRVSVRQSASGQITGVASGRSGSFGRSRSSSFG